MLLSLSGSDVVEWAPTQTILHTGVFDVYVCVLMMKMMKMIMETFPQIATDQPSRGPETYNRQFPVSPSHSVCI